MNNYYLTHPEYITVLSDFFFTKRQFHMGIAKHLDSDVTPVGIIDELTKSVRNWITSNPNSLKFYANKIDRETITNKYGMTYTQKKHPAPKMDITIDFIDELTAKVIEQFDNITDVMEKVDQIGVMRTERLKVQAEYDALSDEEKESRMHEKIARTEDYWASRGHHCN